MTQKDATETETGSTALEQYLARGLAPLREPPPEVGDRVWASVQTRIAARERLSLWGRIEARLTEAFHSRAARPALAVVTAVVLLAGACATPPGQEALAQAWGTITVKMLPKLEVTVNPDGTRSYRLGPPQPMKVIELDGGNMNFFVDGLAPLSEAERQAGFTATKPAALPSGAQLVGASAAPLPGTPAGVKQLRLVYFAGGKPLTLVETVGAAPASPPAGARAVPVGTATGWLQPFGPGIVPPGGANDPVFFVAIDLNTQQASPVPPPSLPSVIGYTLHWSANGRQYALTGEVSPEELVRIAASVR